MTTNEQLEAKIEMVWSAVLAIVVVAIVLAICAVMDRCYRQPQAPIPQVEPEPDQVLPSPRRMEAA